MGRKNKAKKRKSNKFKILETNINLPNDEIKHSKYIQELQKKQQTDNHTKRGMFHWRWRSFLSPTGKLCSGIIFFLSVVVFYYNFSSKLSLNPIGTLNHSDIFTTQFVLRNDSLLWVNLVDHYQFILNNVTIEKIHFNQSKVIFEKPQIPFLESGESTTFILPFNTYFKRNSPINYADIEIIISYYPAFYPTISILRKEYSARFVTVKSNDGTLQWVHKAKSDKIDQP